MSVISGPDSFFSLTFLNKVLPILSDIPLDACAFGDKMNAFNAYNRVIGH